MYKVRVFKTAGIDLGKSAKGKVEIRNFEDTKGVANYVEKALKENSEKIIVEAK